MTEWEFKPGPWLQSAVVAAGAWSPAEASDPNRYPTQGQAEWLEAEFLCIGKDEAQERAVEPALTQVWGAPKSLGLTQ